MTIEARFRIRRGSFVLDVDISAPMRGVTSLLGPSGCGKTTLLRAIAGLERHRDGFLKVGDAVWQDATRFTPPHKRPLGYVFQETSLFEHLSVHRNLEYGMRRVPAGERVVSLDRAIELVGIAPLLERRPATLSGGERQRVAIARALAVSPRLLLMDEPLASLDEESRLEILPYLESLRDELDFPVIYVSHTSDDVVRLAHFLVVLDAGRVVAAGPANDVLTRLDLPPARGGDASVVVDAVVAGHDDAYHLTHVDCEGHRFAVTREALAVGEPVRLRLGARDVSITLERQAGTSILNIFPATVEEVAPTGEGQVTLRLRMGDTRILSRITARSAAALALEPGRQVYAQIKSVALVR